VPEPAHTRALGLLRPDKLVAPRLLSRDGEPKGRAEPLGWDGEVRKGSRHWSSPCPARLTEPLSADPPVRKSERLTGTHAIGSLDTYRALEQHILEGKVLAGELMCQLGLPGCPLPGKEVKRGQGGVDGPQAPLQVLPCSVGLGTVGHRCPGSTCSRTRLPQVLGWAGAGHLWGSASALHLILEECVSLLDAFCGTALPGSPAPHRDKVSSGPGGLAGWSGLGTQLIALVCSQEQTLQGEIAALQAQLSEREDALQSMAERLRSMAQLKDSMEQFIVSQRTWVPLRGGTAEPAVSLCAWGGCAARGPP